MTSNADHCAVLVRAADRGRYLATLFAPATRRDALHALYAFNIEIARVREVAREPMAGEIRLQWWREVVSGERAGEAAGHPVAAALTEAVAQYGLDRGALQTLIDAHAFDLYDAPMATLDELDRYAAETEGALFGGAITALGGDATRMAETAEAAGIAFGIAAMLAGIARQGARLYLPTEVLARHGVAPGASVLGEADAGLRGAVRDLVMHARERLAAAQAGLADAPESVLPALLPVATVGPAMRRIEKRGFDPLRAGPMSAWRQQWSIWRAARDPQRIFGA